MAKSVGSSVLIHNGKSVHGHCVSVSVKESNISSCFETLDMVVSQMCMCLFACVMVKLSFVKDVFRCEKQAVSMLCECVCMCV